MFLYALEHSTFLVIPVGLIKDNLYKAAYNLTYLVCLFIGWFAAPLKSNFKTEKANLAINNNNNERSRSLLFIDPLARIRI